MKENTGIVKIELTKKQYLALLKAVYLGNWMANANRTGSPEDPHVEEYEAISDYVFSVAPQFGFEKYVSHEKGDDTHYYPTNDFEEGADVHKLHAEYDDESFWDELCDRLGERDFYRKYSVEEIKRMDDEERFVKLQECVIVHEKEAEEHGIERLEVMKTIQDLGI